MHLSRPVGWQDTAQGWNFEFPGEKQCCKNEEQEWLSLISPPVIRKKIIPLWTGPAWAAERNLLPPFPMGYPFPWDWVNPGHSRDISWGDFYLSAERSDRFTKTKARGFWSQSSCKHLGAFSQLLQTPNSLIKLRCT